MDPVLLDTDILSAIMRRDARASKDSRAYLSEYKVLTFSTITRYEILRGLKAKGAAKQLAAFETFCAANVILPLTDNIVLQASDTYAELYRQGKLIGDADILIAATALVHGLVLVTNNTSHFKRIAGLTVATWLTP